MKKILIITIFIVLLSISFISAEESTCKLDDGSTITFNTNLKDNYDYFVTITSSESDITKKSYSCEQGSIFNNFILSINGPFNIKLKDTFTQKTENDFSIEFTDNTAISKTRNFNKQTFNLQFDKGDTIEFSEEGLVLNLNGNDPLIITEDDLGEIVKFESTDSKDYSLTLNLEESVKITTTSENLLITNVASKITYPYQINKYYLFGSLRGEETFQYKDSEIVVNFNNKNEQGLQIEDEKVFANYPYHKITSTEGTILYLQSPTDSSGKLRDLAEYPEQLYSLRFECDSGEICEISTYLESEIQLDQSLQYKDTLTLTRNSEKDLYYSGIFKINEDLEDRDQSLLCDYQNFTDAKSEDDLLGKDTEINFKLSGENNCEIESCLFNANKEEYGKVGLKCNQDDLVTANVNTYLTYFEGIYYEDDTWTCERNCDIEFEIEGSRETWELTDIKSFESIQNSNNEKFLLSAKKFTINEDYDITSKTKETLLELGSLNLYGEDFVISKQTGLKSNKIYTLKDENSVLSTTFFDDETYNYYFKIDIENPTENPTIDCGCNEIESSEDSYLNTNCLVKENNVFNYYKISHPEEGKCNTISAEPGEETTEVVTEDGAVTSEECDINCWKEKAKQAGQDYCGQAPGTESMTCSCDSNEITANGGKVSGQNGLCYKTAAKYCCIESEREEEEEPEEESSTRGSTSLDECNEIDTYKCENDMVYKCVDPESTDEPHWLVKKNCESYCKTGITGTEEEVCSERNTFGCGECHNLKEDNKYNACWGRKSSSSSDVYYLITTADCESYSGYKSRSLTIDTYYQYDSYCNSKGTWYCPGSEAQFKDEINSFTSDDCVKDTYKCGDNDNVLKCNGVDYIPFYQCTPKLQECRVPYEQVDWECIDVKQEEPTDEPAYCNNIDYEETYSSEEVVSWYGAAATDTGCITLSFKPTGWTGDSFYCGSSGLNYCFQEYVEYADTQCNGNCCEQAIEDCRSAYKNTCNKIAHYPDNNILGPICVGQDTYDFVEETDCSDYTYTNEVSFKDYTCTYEGEQKCSKDYNYDKKYGECLFSIGDSGIEIQNMGEHRYLYEYFESWKNAHGTKSTNARLYDELDELASDSYFIPNSADRQDIISSIDTCETYLYEKLITCSDNREDICPEECQ